MWQQYYVQNEQYKDLRREAKHHTQVTKTRSGDENTLLSWVRRYLSL